MSLWQLIDAQKGVAYNALFARVTGDPVSGLFLGQLAYWFRPGKNGKSKLRVEKDGKKHLAKNRAEWLDELGITEKQYRRVVSHLRALGLIECRRTLFNNRVTPLLWLDEVRLELLIRLAHEGHRVVPDKPCRAEPIAPKGTNQLVPKGLINTALKADSYNREFTETTTETSLARCARADQPSGDASQSHEEGRVLENVEQAARLYGKTTVVSMSLMERLVARQPDVSAVFGTAPVDAATPPHPTGLSPMASADEILAQRAAQKITKVKGAHGSITSGTVPSAGSLEAIWKAEVNGVTGEFVKPLTMKDIAQLKRVAKEIGEAESTIPATELIMWAVRNWKRFTEQVRLDAGVQQAPALPQVGFFSKYYVTGLQLIAKKQAKAQAIHTPVITEKPESTTTTPQAVPKEAEPALTYEQAMALAKGGAA